MENARIADPEVLKGLAKLLRGVPQERRAAALQAEVETALRGHLGLSVDLSTKEAARRLGVHVNTMHKYLKLGMLPGVYMLSCRAIRIPVADVEALKRRTVYMESFH